MVRSRKGTGTTVKRRGKAGDPSRPASTAAPATPAASPEILAPAGNRESFLAAVSAGADAVYCGLKRFSARMAARNFTCTDLVPLTELAHGRGVKVYVALNTLVRPEEISDAGRLLDQLERYVHPDALIIQDLSLLPLVQQTGFAGKLHLSTLAHVSFASALSSVQESLTIDRVVLPRELSIDEIRTMAGACPEGLGLEVFVHGALCYGVSGRCYWSSYMGGKSGLRGRCVQPCRRVYKQRGEAKRHFSCQDFSLDVLVKVLLTVPGIRAWKIEGRKKGPHYVYHTAKAYRILRDAGGESEGWAGAKKEALDLLSVSLGRSGTHYHFLPQRPRNPIPAGGETGSGLMVGRVKGTRQRPYVRPREPLFPGDVLRVGYEDEPWHAVYRLDRSVPKMGQMQLEARTGKHHAKGSPVFLTDRRGGALDEGLSGLADDLTPPPPQGTNNSAFAAELPLPSRKRLIASDLYVRRLPPEGVLRRPTGLWLSADAVRTIPRRGADRFWWWLPPVIWPEGEGEMRSLLDDVLRHRARHFVLNAPWQMGLFRRTKGLSIWAGPFCNTTNGLAVLPLQAMGFEGVIVSPELGGVDFLELPRQSPLPLGVVISGSWPLCVSRVLSADMRTEQLFTSPMGEQSWVQRHGSDYWVYPNWKLDLQHHKGALQKAGYSLFIHLNERVPRGIKLKRRPGLWNWDLNLQ